MKKILSYFLNNWIVITLIVAAIVSPFLVSLVVSMNNFLWFDMPTSNDWIGFLGSYIGGLFTLLGVLLTLRKQNEQEKKIEDNQFDLTFFKLIDLKNDLSKKITLKVDVDEEEEGINAFNWLSDEIHRLYEEIISQDYKRFNLEINDHIKFHAVNQAYNEIYSKHERALAHYVRGIFYILRSVSNLRNDKEKYISILRTQITQSEIVFLYYYCISLNGSELLLIAKDTSLFDESDKYLLIEKDHYTFIDNLVVLRQEIDEISLFLDSENLIIPEEDDY